MTRDAVFSHNQSHTLLSLSDLEGRGGVIVLGEWLDRVIAMTERVIAVLLAQLMTQQAVLSLQ